VDQLSETGSRPAYGSRPAFLDEFELRLTGALAPQTVVRTTRFGPARTSDANVESPSLPSLDEARAPPTVDFEALLAAIEASLVNDAEAAQVAKPVKPHARPMVAVVRRISRDWKLIAGACALVGVAIVGVVALPRSIFAVPTTAPRAHEPSVRETMTGDDGAEQAPGRALEPSSRAEDGLAANPEGAGATGAPQASEIPGAGATKATIGLTNGASSGSTPQAADLTVPQLSALAVSLAQPSEFRPAPADLTTTASSSLAPLVKPFDLKPVPTVSPHPTPTTTSATFPTERSSAVHATLPSTKPAWNAHGVGTAKLSVPRRDVTRKVVIKPSIAASITSNDWTSAPAVTNQPLPVGSPTNPGKGAIASNVVQSSSPAAVAPGTFGRSLNHAIGRGGVLAQYPVDASDQRPLLRAIGDSFERGTAPAQHSVDPIPRDAASEKLYPVDASDQRSLLRAIGDSFGRGTAPAQHSVDPIPRDVASEKPSQPLPIGTPAKDDGNEREPRAAQTTPASAAAAPTPAAPNGLY
jgi:hypothetical protein